MIALPLCGQSKGAIAIEDCVAYSSSSITSKQIPIKEGTVLAYGKIFPPDWSYTERENGLIRVWYLENPNGSREKLIWVPENSVKEFEMDCQGWVDCTPWETTGLRRKWRPLFLAQARMAHSEYKGDARIATVGDSETTITTEPVEPVDLEDLGKWTYKTEINPITDAVDVVFSLDSDKPTGGVIVAQPVTLVGRLRGRTFELYLRTNFIVESTRNNDVRCTVRYDKNTPTTLDFSQSANSAGLFFYTPIEQALLFTTYDTFAIELTPRNEASRFAVFTLHGLKSCIAKMEADAGIKFKK